MSGFTPMLPVASLKHSLEFYQRALGFTVETADPPTGPIFLSLTRGGTKLFLISTNSRRSAVFGGRGGIRLYLEVDNAADLYQNCQSVGARITKTLTLNEREGYLEFIMRDPDGYEVGVYSLSNPLKEMESGEKGRSDP